MKYLFLLFSLFLNAQETYYVTNLNDSGVGSLRYAVEQQSNRSIEFLIVGTIALESELKIVNDSIDIVGLNNTLRNFPLVISASEVNISNLRIRLGDNGYKDANGNVIGNDSYDYDSVLFYADNKDVENVTLQNCSISWSVDENIGFYTESGYSINNVIINNCIVSEALHNSHHNDGSHSMGVLLHNDCNNISFTNNYFAHNHSRNIASNGGNTFIFNNNVVYNYYEALNVAFGTHFDMINNYYVAINEPFGYISQLSSGGNNGYSESDTLCYVYGNLTNINQIEIEPQLEQYNQNNPLFTTSYDLEYIDNVLYNAGAFPRDEVDERLVNDFYNLTGDFIDTQAQVGGYPILEQNLSVNDFEFDYEKAEKTYYNIVGQKITNINKVDSGVYIISYLYKNRIVTKKYIKK